jgi:predicted dehydrogenase
MPESSTAAFPTIYDMNSAIEFKPEVVIVANATSDHLSTAKNFVDTDCILLIEKPISNDFEETQTFNRLYLNYSNKIAIGYNLRFSKSLLKFRELIHSGLIGEILSVRCQVGKYLPHWRPDRDYTKSVSAKKNLGGGALLELSHEIDYLRWIFGEYIWVEDVFWKQCDLRIDVEDFVYLTFKF